jgi:two-component system, NtrC family, response regulator HydG
MADGARILLVQDDQTHAQALAEALTRSGHSVERAAAIETALERLAAGRFDIVITDAQIDGRGGMELVRAARAKAGETEVMLISAAPTIEDAVESMQRGAAYYFTKPLNIEHVRRVVARSVTAKAAKPAGGAVVPVDAAPAFTEIVATTPPMMRVFDLVNQVAASNATVLIFGESGTGKELVAKAIHGLSQRRGRPFVALNCAALSEGLLDSELFGHEKGAFTGAGAAREGRFEFADKGTLFLDEVGDMPLPVQVKLLRVIQERTITRVGSNQPIEVDVRLIAATHKNLEQEVRRGTFREDLYWRLKVVSIHVPPLRERQGDVPILVERFIGEFARRHGRPTKGLDQDALRLLLQYEWPGNVRELQNVVESMVLLSQKETLGPESVPRELHETRPGTALVAVDALDGMTLKRVERELIRLNLEKFNGNRARAAKALGISERTLYRKIKEYGVP